MVEQREISNPEFGFDEDPHKVAQNIKGATLLVGSSSFTITEVQGFTREENDTGAYRVLLGEAPGTLVGVPHRKAEALPLIVTHDGSCVLIRGMTISDQDDQLKHIKGPGKVSQAIGLISRDVRRITIEDPYA